MRLKWRHPLLEKIFGCRRRFSLQTKRGFLFAPLFQRQDLSEGDHCASAVGVGVNSDGHVAFGFVLDIA